MSKTVSTSATAFDIRSLVKGNDNHVTPLRGRFEQTLVSTKDYRVKLITYVDNKNTEGQPESGVEYEVELFSNSTVRTFTHPIEVMEFVDAHTRLQYGVVKIAFGLESIDRKEFDFVKSGTYKKLKFNTSGVVVSELSERGDGSYSAFIKKDDILKLGDLFNQMKAVLI